MILVYLKQNHPEIYSRVKYFLIDSSPTLHQIQKKLLSGHDNVNIFHQDLSKIATGESILSNEKNPTYIIALEVLDNLPHDKIKRCEHSGNFFQAEVTPVHQSLNMFDEKQEYEEKFVLLSDSLLKNVLKVFPNNYFTSNPKWVPSVAYGFFEKLLKHRPNSKLVIADFDRLPPPDLHDQPPSSRLALDSGGPLVTSEGIDYPCYLSSPVASDILFPTDFQAMRYFISKQLNSNFVHVDQMKQAQFLLRYGEKEVNKTRNVFGYTPLIYDFTNCSVLTTSSRLK